MMFHLKWRLIGIMILVVIDDGIASKLNTRNIRNQSGNKRPGMNFDRTFPFVGITITTTITIVIITMSIVGEKSGTNEKF